MLTVKKQATRYFQQWVVDDQIDKTIKECLNRALKDLARHIPLPNAEELKSEALALRNSWIGIQSNKARGHSEKTKARIPYEYQSANLMKQLLGKNGIRAGWWPYDPDLLEHAERVKNVDKDILKEQWVSSFNTQPKEEVIKQFPKLALLYHKLDAATSFYSEKMASPYAKEAAKAVLAPDFDKLLNNEPLDAISEIDSKTHEAILNRIKYQLQTEGKDNSLIEASNPFNQQLQTFNRVQAFQFQDLDASNDEFTEEKLTRVPNKTLEFPQKSPISLDQIAEQINELKEQLTLAGLSREGLDKVLQANLSQPVDRKEPEDLTVSLNETIEASPNIPTFSMDALRSTAPPLPIESILTSSHLSKTILKEEKLSWDIQTLTAGLNDKSEDFVISLLGEPNRREANQIRYGSNKGSLIVTVKGEKQGLWYDHQTGEGGNLIQLLQKEKNLSFREALNYAGEYLSLAPTQTHIDQIDMTDVEEKLNEGQRMRLTYARELANKSQSIKDTLAETYLKNRGIDPTVCSPFVRFLPAVKEKETNAYHPALLVIGKNLKGNVQCVQVTFLTPEGKKLNCADPKRVYGLPKGALIPVSIGKGNLYGLAEGAETALSVASAYQDMTVFTSLGSFSNFAAIPFSSRSNTLVTFLDHDNTDNPAILKANKALDALHRQGFNVLSCKPSDLHKDYNDVLQEKGIAGVKQQSATLSLHLPANKPSQLPSNKEKSLQKAKKLEAEQELDF